MRLYSTHFKTRPNRRSCVLLNERMCFGPRLVFDVTQLTGSVFLIVRRTVSQRQTSCAVIPAIYAVCIEFYVFRCGVLSRRVCVLSCMCVYVCVVYDIRLCVPPHPNELCVPDLSLANQLPLSACCSVQLCACAQSAQNENLLYIARITHMYYPTGEYRMRDILHAGCGCFIVHMTHAFAHATAQHSTTHKQILTTDH